MKFALPLFLASVATSIVRSSLAGSLVVCVVSPFTYHHASAASDFGFCSPFHTNEFMLSDFGFILDKNSSEFRVVVAEWEGEIEVLTRGRTAYCIQSCNNDTRYDILVSHRVLQSLFH